MKTIIIALVSCLAFSIAQAGVPSLLNEARTKIGREAVHFATHSGKVNVQCLSNYNFRRMRLCITP